MASPSSRLVYVRGRGAETCPDEAALRAAVAARLGYDLSMGLGASLSLGTAPAAVAGGTAHAMLGHGPFAARLGFRGEASGSKSIGDGGRVATHTVLGSLSGCVRGDAPFGCLGMASGR